MNTQTTKVDLTDKNQKIFAGVLAIAALILFYYLLPPLITIFANLWLLAILALPVVFIVLNPGAVWSQFKILSWNLTKKMIAGNKIGYMYRYLDYLNSRITKLNGSINNISGIKTKLTRRLSDLENSINNNLAKVAAYQKDNVSELAIRTVSNKISIDTKQKEALLPKIVDVEAQEKYLIELYDAWVADSLDLKYTLDAKAEEYTLLKELAEATGTASEFLKGNSEEYKLYQESLNQIEAAASSYTANIENFTRQVQPILETISSDRTMSEDAGLRLVEEYKNNKINLKISN